MEHGCLDWCAFLVFFDWQVDESNYLFASHHWGEVLLISFKTCFFIVDVVISDSMVLCKVLLASWIRSRELMLTSHGGFRKIPLHFLRCYWTKKSSMDIVKKHMVCRRPFKSTDQTESCQLGRLGIFGWQMRKLEPWSHVRTCGWGRAWRDHVKKRTVASKWYVGKHSW